MGKRSLIHIEILRTFALLCVIYFHVTGMLSTKICVPGMSTILYSSSLLVGIAVPLFMFISGYLYKPVESSQILSFIKKKALRLWFPYIVFSIFIMITSGFFSFSSLLSGGFYHLWFLTALFWCFIFSIKINYASVFSFFILPITLVCSIISIPDFLGLQDFIQWFYFFVLGAIVKSHANAIVFLRKYLLWVPLVLFYVGVNIFVPFHYREPSIIHALAESAIILSIWTLLEPINLKISLEGKVRRLFLAIGSCSMGIYILHYWLLIYILSSTSFSIFHIALGLQNYTFVTVIIIVFVTFICSLFITNFARRYKFGRLLLG